jgi:hypothetical protein
MLFIILAVLVVFIGIVALVPRLFASLSHRRIAAFKAEQQRNRKVIRLMQLQAGIRPGMRRKMRRRLAKKFARALRQEARRAGQTRGISRIDIRLREKALIQVLGGELSRG